MLLFQFFSCKLTVASGQGCKPVSPTPADITVNIDADREVERIHSLFLSNMNKLEQLEGMLRFFHWISINISCLYDSISFEQMLVNDKQFTLVTESPWLVLVLR